MALKACSAHSRVTVFLLGALEGTRAKTGSCAEDTCTLGWWRAKEGSEGSGSGTEWTADGNGSKRNSGVNHDHQNHVRLERSGRDVPLPSASHEIVRSGPHWTPLSAFSGQRRTVCSLRVPPGTVRQRTPAGAYRSAAFVSTLNSFSLSLISPTEAFRH